MDYLKIQLCLGKGEFQSFLATFLCGESQDSCEKLSLDLSEGKAGNSAIPDGKTGELLETLGAGKTNPWEQSQSSCSLGSWAGLPSSPNWTNWGGWQMLVPRGASLCCQASAGDVELQMWPHLAGEEGKSLPQPGPGLSNTSV